MVYPLVFLFQTLVTYEAWSVTHGNMKTFAPFIRLFAYKLINDLNWQTVIPLQDCIWLKYFFYLKCCWQIIQFCTSSDIRHHSLSMRLLPLNKSAWENLLIRYETLSHMCFPELTFQTLRELQVIGSLARCWGNRCNAAWAHFLKWSKLLLTRTRNSQRNKLIFSLTSSDCRSGDKSGRNCDLSAIKESAKPKMQL